MKEEKNEDGWEEEDLSVAEEEEELSVLEDVCELEKLDSHPCWLPADEEEFVEVEERQVGRPP